MSEPLRLQDPDRVTVGAVGPPGRRTFLLQFRQGGEVVTVKLEKGQVRALAKYVGELLADLPRPGHLPEDLDLVEPSEPRWAVGSLGLTYVEELDRLVLVVEEAVADGEEDEDGDEVHVFATREQMAALAIRGTTLVEAGRPPCPLCNYPLDPSGHVCPKANGNRPPKL